MADNRAGWRQPVGGRLKDGSSDYVGTNGFGHEDWNFSRDIWSDGKCHLYVRQEPAVPDRDKTFCIVLGTRTSEGHFAVGFCENATYACSSLGKNLNGMRASQLDVLDRANELRGPLSGLAADEKARRLFDDGEVYWISVNQADLIVLNTPVAIPELVVKRGYNRYGLVRLDQSDYEGIRRASQFDSVPENPDEALFAEGTSVARTHLHRERDPRVVRGAKEGFLKLHGQLHCEACNWLPDLTFPDAHLASSLIEAHHDIPLSSPDHDGTTKVSDIRMLCPNCHRAIHSIRPWLRVGEFRKRFFEIKTPPR